MKLAHIVIGLALALAGCGDSSSSSSSAVDLVRTCWGIAGDWVNGSDRLSISNDNFKWCRYYDYRCGEDIYLQGVEAGIGTLNRGADFVDPPLHADCPSGRYPTCQYTRAGDSLTVDCGGGVRTFTLDPS